MTIVTRTFVASTFDLFKQHIGFFVFLSFSILVFACGSFILDPTLPILISQVPKSADLRLLLFAFARQARLLIPRSA